MSNSFDHSPSPDLPSAVAEAPRRRSIPFIWVLPLVAALIGGGLIVKGILDRGPTITITFKTAEGLEAGKTKIKYKSVEIGTVKQIALSKDQRGVLVTAELGKDAEPYLVDDNRFWVVRPLVSGGQVSGLGTLLSGSFIGMDIGKSTVEQRDYIGLEAPPIVAADVPGRHFVLVSNTLGSLGIGSPVQYRQIDVGSVAGFSLNPDGTAVTIKIFINAPYDQYVTAATRFWNSSGIDFSLDATGLKVDTQSLASILIGGIAFETPPDSAPGSPAEENHTFALADNRSQARKLPDELAVPLIMYFKDSLRGLAIGAPVEFRGVPVGEVQSMRAEYDEAQAEYRFPVRIAVYPGRLAAMASQDEAHNISDANKRRERWDRLVAHGLRGQLQPSSLLTGQLYVAMEIFPDAPAQQIDWTKTPPVIPTVVGSMTEIQDTLPRLIRKLDQVPLDQISKDLRQTLQAWTHTMNNANQLVMRLDTDLVPTARLALTDLQSALKTVEHGIGTDAPIQQDLRDMLRELNRSAQSVRSLADYLERHPESLLRGRKGDDK